MASGACAHGLDARGWSGGRREAYRREMSECVMRTSRGRAEGGQAGCTYCAALSTEARGGAEGRKGWCRVQRCTGHRVETGAGTAAEQSSAASESSSTWPARWAPREAAAQLRRLSDFSDASPWDGRLSPAQRAQAEQLPSGVTARTAAQLQLLGLARRLLSAPRLGVHRWRQPPSRSTAPPMQPQPAGAAEQRRAGSLGREMRGKSGWALGLGRGGGGGGRRG